MKANEFVKKYGLDAAKAKVAEFEVLEDLGDEICGQQVVLKRLVKSYELLEKFGKDKWIFIANYCQEHRLAPHQSDVYSFVSDKFDKAIADVESCQMEGE